MRITRAGWVLMTVLSVSIVIVAAQYLSFDPAVYFPQQRAVYGERELALGAHIAGAMVALAVGPWQFSRRLRRRLPRLHRGLGVLYLLGCLIGAAGGLVLSLTAHGGVAAGLGFAALAVCWLVTGGAGLRMILAGRAADHRRWMTRSFALTFAAVTLRLMLGTYGGLSSAGLVDLDFTSVYVAVAWLCWVPNLAIAWWFTRTRPRSVVALAGRGDHAVTAVTGPSSTTGS
ncbi:DUF2306 domain-containing protein [Streptosporangium sp. NPDC000396]|uniref:DUF2306 domain-containing protein n=1 Tax=Streptosporangium sp. NPDC000396 TaxID=3366185 RepID=UPI0036AC8FBF